MTTYETSVSYVSHADSSASTPSQQFYSTPPSVASGDESTSSGVESTIASSQHEEVCGNGELHQHLHNQQLSDDLFLFDTNNTDGTLINHGEYSSPQMQLDQDPIWQAKKEIDSIWADVAERMNAEVTATTVCPMTPNIQQQYDLSGMVMQSPMTPIQQPLYGNVIPQQQQPQQQQLHHHQLPTVFPSTAQHLHHQYTSTSVPMDATSSLPSPSPPSSYTQQFAQHTQQLQPSDYQQQQQKAQQQQQPSQAQPPSDATTPSVTPPQTKSTAVKRACIACRRQKTSCNGSRPCDRCKKAGRECIDRTDAEIEAAKSRRTKPVPDTTMKGGVTSHKRSKDTANSNGSTTSPNTPTSNTPNSTAASAASSPSASDPASYAHSLEATDRISSQLYSNTALVVLQHMKLRDHILRWHAQLDALPIPAEGMYEWHSQVGCMLLQLADSMHIDDFECWLLSGLTEEQLNSSLWTSSPLAPWAKLSTRPLHWVIQPNTLQLHELSQPPTFISQSQPPTTQTAQLDADPNSIQLKIEWLPAANKAFKRYSDLLLAKLKYETDLKEEKRQQRNLLMQQQIQQGLLPPPSTSFVTQTGTEVMSICNPWNTTGTPSLFWTSPELGGCQNHLGSQTISEEDDLADHFSVLAIGRTLSAVPPPAQSEHDLPTGTHANWCPRGGPAQFMESEDSHFSNDSNKSKRCGNMSSAHTDGVSADADLPACICSLSTPLVSRVWVNSGFASIFGWRRCDVEVGMQSEGLRWCRRLYPPSTWRLCRQAQTEQSAVTLELVAMKLMREATKKMQANGTPVNCAFTPSANVVNSYTTASTAAPSSEPKMQTSSSSSSLTSLNPSSSSAAPSPATFRQEMTSQIQNYVSQSAAITAKSEPPQGAAEGVAGLDTMSDTEMSNVAHAMQQDGMDWNTAVKYELQRRQQQAAIVAAESKLAAGSATQPGTYTLMHTSPFITRRGAILAAASKELRVEMTDGKTTTSAVIISWSVPKGITPIPPMSLLRTSQTGKQQQQHQQQPNQ